MAVAAEGDRGHGAGMAEQPPHRRAAGRFGQQHRALRSAEGEPAAVGTEGGIQDQAAAGQAGAARARGGVPHLDLVRPAVALERAGGGGELPAIGAVADREHRHRVTAERHALLAIRHVPRLDHRGIVACAAGERRAVRRERREHGRRDQLIAQRQHALRLEHAGRGIPDLQVAADRHGDQMPAIGMEGERFEVRARSAPARRRRDVPRDREP